MRNWAQIAGACLLLLLLTASPAAAQAGLSAAPTATIEVQALPALNVATNFDPALATEAYLRRVSGSERFQSDTYFEGRYWLNLLRVLYALLVAGGLLWLRVSAAMRDLAERATRNRFWQVPIYVVQYILLVTVLTFPLTVYQNYVRENIFELSNQTFGQWFGTFAIGTAVSLVLATLLLTILYWVVRKARQAWWLWGASVSVLFLVFLIALLPNVIAPLFVNYTPLPEGKVKTDIQAMAQANGVDVNAISVVNVSDRNRRISAGVLGFGKSARIIVSDNLIKQGTPAEVKIAVAQEIGHSVMNHTFTGLVMFSVLIFAGFAFAHYGFILLVDIFGGNWDVRRLDDPAGLPVFIAATTLFFLFASPLTNWIGRSQEKQADLFALNAARQPDALATLVLKQSPYVKLEPGELEETLFYNQPSGRSRIGTAMRWKAANLTYDDIANGPISPQ